MPGGTLPEYIKNNPDADRLRLVGIQGISPVLLMFIPVASYLMSRVASTTSIPARWSTVTSREYVIILDLISLLY